MTSLHDSPLPPSASPAAPASAAVTPPASEQQIRPVLLHATDDDNESLKKKDGADVSAAAAAVSDRRTPALAASGASSAGGYPPVCPEETASFFSFTYLIWLNPLFTLGNQRTLEENDVPEVREDVSAAHVSALFRQKWDEQMPRYLEEERAKEQAQADLIAKGGDAGAAASAAAAASSKKPISLNFSLKDKVDFQSYRLLFRTLNAMYGRRYWLCGLLKSGYDAASFTQPMLLAALVSHVQLSQSSDASEHPPAWRGYALAAGMLAVNMAGITFMNLFQRTTYGIGLRARTALITALYRKSFRLSPAARSQMSTGQIVNMMSTDATMVDQCGAWVNKHDETQVYTKAHADAQR